ncbi:MAG: hypothetical protein IJ785_05210 [Bacteroidales bacterium]|nr:hypothetical protein [Bacteroidales bacterium]
MIQQEVKQIFHCGERITNEEARRRLRTIFDRYDINRKPKATDLLLYGIKTKRIAIKQGEKRVEGVAILST